MAYNPFPENRTGGVPYTVHPRQMLGMDVDATEGDAGDGDMPAGDYSMGQGMTSGSRALPHVDPSENLENWASELREMNSILQEQHTDLERSIDQATRRKVRCEGQIEMVMVTLRHIEEQLQFFADAQKRVAQMKVAY